MEKIYNNFIQYIKDRDYESICWILNNTDLKALYNLISEMNPISNIDEFTSISIRNEQKSATISLSKLHDIISIGVRFFKDEETDYNAIMNSLCFKFPSTMISVQPIEDTFSIRRFARLQDDHAKFEKEDEFKTI